MSENNENDREKRRYRTNRTVTLAMHLSTLSLSLRRNFSLSSSTILSMLSTKTFLSGKQRLETSTSSSITFPSSSTCLSTLFLMRSKVGKRSMAVHLSSSSSSSCVWRPLTLNTSGAAIHVSLKLPVVKLRRLLTDATKSSPASAEAIRLNGIYISHWLLLWKICVLVVVEWLR